MQVKFNPSLMRWTLTEGRALLGTFQDRQQAVEQLIRNRKRLQK